MKKRVLQSIRAAQAMSADIKSKVLNRQQLSRYPIVVMYHSVPERPTRDWGPWKYAITPQSFDQQLAKIDKDYSVISIEKLVDWLVNNKPIPHDSVVLTFDDAYRDFKTKALPILEKYDFPATVYVPTELLNENKAPFEHRLGDILFKQGEINVAMRGFSINTSLRTTEEVIDAHENIRSELKFSSVEQREQFLKKLESDSESDDIIMNSDEMQELRDHSLVTIGAHGHEHVPLPALSAKEQKRNVEACHDRLTDLLGDPPKHFSFPYGSFDESAIQAVKETGFESAVTTQTRPVSPRDWGRPYTIPRIDAATGSMGNSVEIFSMEQ
jgi:peptidoglycan/xylan/chitin deacetylase (PgdA/CDA1 family)